MALTDNNCRFEWVSPTDGVTSYQVQVNPEIDIFFERKQEIHELDDGNDKLYKKCFKFHCLLTWGSKKWFEAEQRIKLSEIYSASTGVTFYPYPNKAPTANYNVALLAPKEDLHLVKGVTNIGYNGTVKLTGTDKYDSIPINWIISGE